MNDSTRTYKTYDDDDDDKVDHNVNHFYTTNYISLEDNLEALKERVDEDFYFQEDSISGLIKKMDESKGEFLRRLDDIEKEYAKILRSSQSVFDQISRSEKKVEDFDKIEKSFISFVGNVRALDREIAKTGGN